MAKSFIILVVLLTIVTVFTAPSPSKSRPTKPNQKPDYVPKYCPSHGYRKLVAMYPTMVKTTNGETSKAVTFDLSKIGCKSVCVDQVYRGDYFVDLYFFVSQKKDKNLSIINNTSKQIEIVLC